MSACPCMIASALSANRFSEYLISFVYNDKSLNQGSTSVSTAGNSTTTATECTATSPRCTEPRTFERKVHEVKLYTKNLYRFFIQHIKYRLITLFTQLFFKYVKKILTILYNILCCVFLTFCRVYIFFDQPSCFRTVHLHLCDGGRDGTAVLPVRPLQQVGQGQG